MTIISPDHFDLSFSDDGKLIDFLSGDELDPTPEERVRQRFLRVLHFEYGYPRNLMRREVGIYHGHDLLKDKDGSPVRADIVIYRSASACAKKDQGKFYLVVECKAPNITSGYNQLVSYIFSTSAEGGVWFNGSGADDEIQYFRRFHTPSSELKEWIGVPRHNEPWDALGRRRKADLLRPKDIRGLLRRCHNRIHGRGNDGDEEDLTMDMVRIILAKAMDEESSSELPDFYCAPDEYEDPAGRKVVAERINVLFETVKKANPDIFADHEKISVGPRAICDVVVELQDYQLLSELSAAADWDLMGHAYEQYTSVYLKRERGQYFTNRLAIDLLVGMVDPNYMDVVLDPAGGSGGFLTGVMRYVRQGILGTSGSDISKARQLDRHRTNLFMVEISKRLVKVAKTAMILNGDGHTGMTAGDSLGPYNEFDKTIVARANRGTPNVILTNPPFAGVGDGRITHVETLRQFESGRKWALREGTYTATDEFPSDGVPPELLFFERCVDWLAPGGRLGIVMPKSFLDTQTYRPGRELLFRECRLLAVINCHKNTFQPHTGVRTCLIVLQKNDGKEYDSNYHIFMAISRKVGQDSEGVPIFKRDAQNKHIDELDEDLSDIGAAFDNFRKGSLVHSGYIFSIKRDEVDSSLRINPQMFLPHLNETIESIEKMDGVNGWSVSTLGALDKDIKIFKGPRFKSESIIVEEPGKGIEPYYTPSALLQEKSESVKLLDVTKASKKQISTINAIRVYRGDIVITRSGSIGRVSYITMRYDGAIVSDDLIRVRIPNEELRLYVLSFLQTSFAQDQMLRNEYGAIQQHLEPEHIRNLLIPMLDCADEVARVSSEARLAIQKREELEAQNSKAIEGMAEFIGRGVSEAADVQPSDT